MDADRITRVRVDGADVESGPDGRVRVETRVQLGRHVVRAGVEWPPRVVGIEAERHRPSAWPRAAAAALALALLAWALAVQAAPGSAPARALEATGAAALAALDAARDGVGAATERVQRALGAEGGAALERSSVLALEVGPPGRADGFLRGPNLAPGDVVRGALVLDAPDSARDGTRLSFRVEPVASGDAAGARLEDALVLQRLRYADVDLMPRATSLDADGDARVTLRELRPGLAGLSAPRASAFEVAVLFAPPPGDGSAYAGQTLDAVFVFTLAEDALA